ncbi:MAG: hypothetical protein M0R06_00580 [Sphaerochaeta sp.]|jgi:hypothetical protein|nr:hypothetical protein [Sphaerochaeta sp.]
MTQVFRHVKLGQPCVYKKVACSFKGDCRDCPVWKKKEIEMLSKDDGL